MIYIYKNLRCLKGIKFHGYLISRFRNFFVKSQIKYHGEMLQVYNYEIKYPRNLISGGSKTTFYHKKNSYIILLSQMQTFLI